MAAIAALRIDGPAPTPRPYGIVETPGTIVPQDDPHWRAGVVIDSYPTDLPDGHNPCAVGTLRVKAEGTTPPAPEFSSFTVVYPFTCSGIGLGNEAGAERARSRVREAFAATESYQVERELAFGESDPDRPFFTKPASGAWLGATFPAGGANTAVGPRESVALLENAIGGTARAGFLHTDPATFSSWVAWNLVDTDGRRAYTKVKGTTVIVGDGYIGARIGAALAADEGFAFATGPVELTRDDQIEVLGPTAQVLDTETNLATFRAERNYVAYWDTALLAAVRVDRSATP
jgi:hypothetical protein